MKFVGNKRVHITAGGFSNYPGASGGKDPQWYAVQGGNAVQGRAQRC